MYIIVVYDANETEQQLLRSTLFKQLNRIQNSVFAGEMTRIEAEGLATTLKNLVHTARVHMWTMPHAPDIARIGRQTDEESPFI